MPAGVDHSATFRQEAAELLAQLEGVLLDLLDRPEDRELVDTAFRALHTLKGSGSMFGFDALAAFAHDVESTFDQLRNGRLVVSPEVVNLTLAATDHIRVLVEAPETADRIRGDVLLASFRDILRSAGPTPEKKVKTAPPPTGSVPRGSGEGAATYRVRFRPGRDVMRFGTRPLLLLEELRALGHCDVTALTDDIPPLDEIDPTACYMAWDVLLTTSQPREKIEDVFLFVADQSELQIERLPELEPGDTGRRLGEILVERGDIAAEVLTETLEKQERIGNLLVREGKISSDRLQSALAEQQHLNEVAQNRQVTSAVTSIRVPARRLDELMDQVGELVIAQARLLQTAAASDDLVLKSVTEEIGRLVSGLRDTTMSIRMLPIGNLFNKFRRVVHDLSSELGKNVEMTMSGEETELDKTVIENLNDPLVHLVRNAIDHGIEDAATRAQRGKPMNGRIHLAAVHSGAQVLITISDDGDGLDREAIRARAEERGLVTAGQELTDSELFAFVFQPGFSTNRVVTGISGRGVGMDVVRRTIDSLRGSIDIESVPERGTAITCRLPLTLAIIDGLLVRVANSRYVIPLSAIEECVELTREQDSRSGGYSFLNIRGIIVPFIRLRELFGASGPAELFQKVVIVAAGEVRVGLVVDQVIGQYQTVIKSLSKLHRNVEEFSGATILGDGSVALILDIPHLIDFAQAREMMRKAG
ncbi:MAG: chemotaxis protein CheW [Alphaproteobacteria bacterium]